MTNNPWCNNILLSVISPYYINKYVFLSKIGKIAIKRCFSFALKFDYNETFVVYFSGFIFTEYREIISSGHYYVKR